MKKYFMLLALLLLAPSAARAEYSPWMNATGYSNKAFQKLIYGVQNVALGWTEIITEPGQHHNNSKQLANSMAKGLMNAVTDTVGGALHAATFPFTTVDVVLPDKGIKL